MVISENTLKWAMRLYPPLFFQRIWTKKFGPGFTSAEVKINKSVFNKNYNDSIFGGTIFTASDPYYALLFDQILQRRGFKVRVWLKSATIDYIKAARTDMHFKIAISEADIAEAEHILNTVGKYIKAFPIEMYNTNNELCVVVMNEVYIRNLHVGEERKIAY